MHVRPATSHAVHDRQRIFGRRAAMFSRSRLAHTQLGVLAAAPMNRKHHVARLKSVNQAPIDGFLASVLAQIQQLMLQIPCPT
jgi:hypothetical protein